MSFHLLPQSMAARARLYFALMNLATFVTLLLFPLEIAFFGVDAEQAMGPLYTIYVAVVLAAILLPMVLMFAGFLRDDFAESCWRQSAVTTVKWLTLLPILGSFGLGVRDGYMEAHQGTTQPHLLHDASAADALSLLWALILLLFVLSFQWHRWKASR